MTPDPHPKPAELDPGMVEEAARALYELDPLPNCGDGSWDALLAKAAEPGMAGSIAASIVTDRRDSARAALSAANVPGLVAEVERLKAQVERWQDAAEASEAQVEMEHEIASGYMAQRDAALSRATSAEQERDRLRAGIEALNLHRYVPDRDDLADLCQDDECLWWDMTRATQRALLAGPGEQPGEATLPVPDGVKMMRETLCAAQAAVLRDGGSRRTEHANRLQILIDACDEHRPLGPNGKHGDMHTPTCGCDGNRPAPVVPELDEGGPRACGCAAAWTCEHDAPVVPDSGNAHEPGDDEHLPGVNVTQPVVPDSTDVREAMREALAPYTHADDRERAIDAVLAVVGQGERGGER